MPIDANRFLDEITFPLSSLFEKKVQKWNLDILLFDLGFSQFFLLSKGFFNGMNGIFDVINFGMNELKYESF